METQQLQSGVREAGVGPPPPQASQLEMETITWSRDSHELFDYETKVVAKKKFSVTTSNKVFRRGPDVSMEADGTPWPADADYLLSVRAPLHGGDYMVCPADRMPGMGVDVQPKKLWLIVKDLKERRHPLQVGDMIKLGRFKLRVKQLVKSGDTLPEVRLDDAEPPSSYITQQEAETMQCRICLLEGYGGEKDPLICPCRCKGSIKYIHVDCLRQWINGRLNVQDESQMTFFYKQLHCELCKAGFPSAVEINQERHQIVHVPRTEAPFIVLECSGSNSSSRGIHVMSMAEKPELVLGRGHESDVRLPDVSISRCHAKITFSTDDDNNSNFILEDNNSKFGTLVGLKKPTKVPNTADEKLAVQVGRTVLHFSLTSQLKQETKEEEHGVHNATDPQASRSMEISKTGDGDAVNQSWQQNGNVNGGGAVSFGNGGNGWAGGNGSLNMTRMSQAHLNSDPPLHNGLMLNHPSNPSPSRVHQLVHPTFPPSAQSTTRTAPFLGAPHISGVSPRSIGKGDRCIPVPPSGMTDLPVNVPVASHGPPQLGSTFSGHQSAVSASIPFRGSGLVGSDGTFLYQQSSPQTGLSGLSNAGDTGRTIGSQNCSSQPSSMVNAGSGYPQVNSSFLTSGHGEWVPQWMSPAPRPSFSANQVGFRSGKSSSPLSSTPSPSLFNGLTPPSSSSPSNARSSTEMRNSLTEIRSGTPHPLSWAVDGGRIPSLTGPPNAHAVHSKVIGHAGHLVLGATSNQNAPPSQVNLHGPRSLNAHR
eukprot:GHVN01066421.1.p1 GENE.GHVN01066421.1~~GHVN01066421.1.p1  ORF type:complete len:760 (-),score=78.87 GHVN01066421.1:2745-5024(-)